MDVWLANPQRLAPGTSMRFPGVPDPQPRFRDAFRMREFILSPLTNIGSVLVVPLVVLLLVIGAALMWVGKLEGWIKVGRLNQTTGESARCSIIYLAHG
jgi:hypothetical protein